jgi:hypothetical protein
MIGNRPANHAEPQPRTRMTALSSFFMNRLLSCTTIALLVGLVPALAAENATPASPGAQQGSNTGASSALPTQPGATPETSKSATMPPSGGADQSGGATERSSNPPASGAAKMKSSKRSNLPPALRIHLAEPWSGALRLPAPRLLSPQSQIRLSTATSNRVRPKNQANKLSL